MPPTDCHILSRLTLPALPIRSPGAAVSSHGASPPSWTRSAAAAVSVRLREGLPKAPSALAAEFEALVADVAGGEDGERLLRSLRGEHGGWLCLPACQACPRASSPFLATVLGCTACSNN